MAVDTEDLINSAIDARAARDAQRAQIAQRREQIARQLSGVSGGRRNRGQIASLQAELANLGAAERNLHHQDTVDQANVALRANTAFRNAHLAASEAKLNRDADVATAAANLQNGLARLQAKYPNRILDSTQAAAFHKELSDLRDANPLGLRNESTAAMLRQASEFHDKERERVVNRLQGTLFKQANLSPEQFVSGLDSARATNVPLKKADGTAPTKNEIEKARATNGQTVAMEVNGVTKLFDRGLFDNLKATFGNQPTPQAVTIAPEQPSIQPIVPTYGGQGAAPPGALVRNPDGSVSPIIPVHTGEGAAAPGAMVNTGGYSFQATGTPEDQQAQVAGFRDAAQANEWRQGEPLSAPDGSINPPPMNMPSGPTASGGYASRTPLPMSSVPQTPVGARDEIARQTEYRNQPPVIDQNQITGPRVLMNNEFAVPDSTSLPSLQVAAQPAVNPRTALAQKALDDPNATEAHKAAARHILGIQ